MTSRVTGGKTEAYKGRTKETGFGKGRSLEKRRRGLGALCPLPGLSQAVAGAFAGRMCEIPADLISASSCRMQTGEGS